MLDRGVVLIHQSIQALSTCSDALRKRLTLYSIILYLISCDCDQICTFVLKTNSFNETVHRPEPTTASTGYAAVLVYIYNTVHSIVWIGMFQHESGGTDDRT